MVLALPKSEDAMVGDESRFLVEGDATKHFSVNKKRDFFSEKGPGRQFSESGAW